MDQKSLIPTDIVVYKEIHREEIDFKEIFKLIYSYKMFIISFILLSLISVATYIYLAKPVYKISAQIELGSYIEANRDMERRAIFLEPERVVALVDYKYNDKSSKSKKYPKIQIKQESGLLNITIEDYSNKDALKRLNGILNFIKSKELIKLNNYKKFITKEISILDNSEKDYTRYIKELFTRLNNQSHTKAENNIILQISEYKKLIHSVELEKNRYQYLLSIVEDTKIINQVKKSNKPLTPNIYILLLTVLIISSLLSIFVIFFMEFIKEDQTSN